MSTPLPMQSSAWWCIDLSTAPAQWGSGPGARGPLIDWYEMLGIEPNASDAELAEAVGRLSRQASVMANTAPERSQRLRDQVRAIRGDLLAGEVARTRYDRLLAETKRMDNNTEPVSPRQEPMPPTQATNQIQDRYNPVQASARSVPSGGEAYVGDRPSVLDAVVANVAPAVSRFRRFLQSGWTCPSCGTEGGPADKFCSKCGASMKSAPLAATPAAGAICAECSAALGPTARFCVRCGTPVT